MSARRAWALAFAWVALGCKDPGVIGETNACVPSCAEELVCDTAQGECVACLSSDDCGDGARCADGACVPRESSDDGDDDGDGDGDGDDEGSGDDGHDGDGVPSDSDDEGTGGSGDDGDERPPGDGAAGEGEGDEG